MKTVKTWLPVFTGFYNTIFEPCEDSEIEYINEQRRENGIDADVDFDKIEFNYSEYKQNVCECCVAFIESELSEYVSKITLEKLSSPREYNFANDAIHIEIELTKKNESVIMAYLLANETEFAEYIKARYTSCSGFISSYSNDPSEWMNDADLLTHEHKLGSILEFICQNESINEEDMYYSLTDCSVYATNYDELIKG
jgi:hypothetical protein